MLQTARFPIAAALALVVTGALFWFLWAMIHVNLKAGEHRQAVKIEFTRLRRDSDVKTIKREKPELQKPAQAQALPQISTSAAAAAPEKIAIDAPVVDARGSLRGMLGGLATDVSGTDRDVIPLVRIEPDYPSRAADHGTEGWVVVQFTITAAGTVKDAQVVESQPQGVFDSAATKAVERWKYNPKIENGVAVERRGVQVIFTFKLEKGKKG